MKTKLCLALIYVLGVFILSCEKDDDGYKKFNEISLLQINYYTEINNVLYYNLNGQVEKEAIGDNIYYIYLYDSYGRMIKKSIYYGPAYPEYENQLTSYDTIIYESNKIIEKNFSDDYTLVSFELAYFNEYILNSKNEYIKLVTYDRNGIKSDSTEITWSNGNIIEYTITWNDGSWRKGKYKYDNEYNPYLLCSNIISPWLLTKNNLTRVIRTRSNSEVVDTSYWKYEYNDYGYPIKREGFDGVQLLGNYEEFVYKIN